MAASSKLTATQARRAGSESGVFNLQDGGGPSGGMPFDIDRTPSP
ncbi:MULTISPECIES: hypothetical protein [Ectothiorhodospira]|nr:MULTISPECIES: hypothetical protein [Ectothiorhodospira]